MTSQAIRDWLRSQEQADPAAHRLVLCFLAGRAVEIDPADANAALRRAELLLAAGGDPHRPLDVDGRAVGSLAADLDVPARRDSLAAGLAGLAAEADGLPAATAALQLLRADADLAWRCFAAALLAEALDADDDG